MLDKSTPQTSSTHNDIAEKSKFLLDRAESMYSVRGSCMNH
jgi:hypothetical protein